jgi:transmembrane sensor
MKPIPFPNIEVIAEAASKWVAAMDRGLNNDEKEALENWLEQSPIHAEYMVKLASVWDLMDVLAPISHFLPLDTPLDEIEKQLARKAAQRVNAHEADNTHNRWRNVRYAAAACFLAATIATTWLATSSINSPAPIDLVYSDPSLSSFTATYATGIGKYSEITLPDGSELKLNTSTNLVVEYTNSERRIKLHSGEAFFKVAKNPNQPFRVVAGNSAVTAIGTAFNVKIAAESNIQVLVTEGKVVIDPINANTPVNVASLQKLEASVSNGQVQLGIWQQLTIDNQGNLGPIALLSEEQQDAPLAWQDGMLLFEGEPLSKAISEINRYTSKTFHITDQSIADILVGGYFKANDTEQLLVMLDRNFGIVAEHNGDRIALFRRQ